MGLFQNIKTLVAPPPEVEQGEDDPFFFDVETEQPQEEDGDDTAVANG